MPDDWLRDGETVVSGSHVLEVVNTPGHTRGHVVFPDTAAGLLFTGDHVLPTITPSIGFDVAPSPNPLGNILASLAVVRGRPDARLLPAHGAVAESVHARIDQLVHHHGERLGAVEELVRRGAATAYEVAGRLGWIRHDRQLAALELFNQMLAVAETAVHLELLVGCGPQTRRAYWPTSVPEACLEVLPSGRLTAGSTASRVRSRAFRTAARECV